MANNYSAAFDEMWDKQFQEVFLDKNVAREIADTQFEKVLVHGDVLHRPSTDDVSVQEVTRGVDMTIDSQTISDETMTIQFERGVMTTLHGFDETQSNLDIAARYAMLTAEALSRQVDADVLGEVVNADTVLDAGDFGGTAGEGIVVSDSNVQKIYSKVSESNRISVISYDVEEQMNNLVSGKETAQGDLALKKAYMGDFQDFKVFKSNQTRATGRWTPADNPTDGATITFGGITLNLVSTIGTTAGNVLIGASTADTLDNIVTLINAPATTTATGVALSTADARKVSQNFSITDGATYIDVVCNGVGLLDAASSEAADVWSLEKQHLIFGVKGFTSLIVQDSTTNRITDAPYQNAKNFLSDILYGVKSFADQTRKMVRVEVDSSGF
jgi:hypothetical protein